MRQIIDEYGGAILTGAGAALVLGIFTALIFGVFSDKMTVFVNSADDGAVSVAKEAMQEYESAEEPTIKAKETGIAGRHYAATDLFLSDGELTVLRVFYMNANDAGECSRKCLLQDGKIKFPEPGVYRLRVRSVNEARRQIVADYFIGVEAPTDFPGS